MRKRFFQYLSLIGTIFVFLPSSHSAPQLFPPPFFPNTALELLQLNPATNTYSLVVQKKSDLSISIHFPNLTTNATVVVLGYHQFNSPIPNPYSITSTNFYRQMQFLKDHGWSAISLKDLVLFLRGKTNLPEKSVLITIDDGYRSVYLHAYPILKSFNYPWVFFCYTDFINRGPQSVTWEQLREMQKNGCTVQSHTKTHPKLTQRNGKTEAQYETWLKQELAYSKYLLEKKLGTSVYALAYSYGDWDPHVQKRALQYGYQALFTVYGTSTKRHTPLDRIGRIIITTENESLFSHYLRAPTVKVLSPTNLWNKTNAITPSPTSSAPLH